MGRYEITPPPAIRTVPISRSRELQLAREKLFTDVLPLFMRSFRYIFDINIFDIFNVFRPDLPEDGILCFFLEPARMTYVYYVAQDRRTSAENKI